MGSIGNAMTTTVTPTPEEERNRVADDLNSFYNDLKGREVGTSKKMVSQTQQDEFKNIYRDMVYRLERDGDSDRTFIFGGGFASGAKNPDQYVHTIAKLNSYQRLVSSYVRSTASDLKYNFITTEEAKVQLRALRNIDIMIAERRRALKELGRF